MKAEYFEYTRELYEGFVSDDCSSISFMTIEGFFVSTLNKITLKISSGRSSKNKLI